MDVAPRRAFLRQLCALPLIGGGLTIVGAPTAIAEPVTEPLFRRYAAWVAREHVECLVEACEIDHAGAEHVAAYAAHQREWAQEFCVFRKAAAVHPIGKPSARAALVLSAVGCDWRQREGGR